MLSLVDQKCLHTHSAGEERFMYRFRTKQIFGGRYVTPACRFSAPRYAVTQIFGARAAREEKIRLCDFPWKWCALRLCNVRVHVQVNRIIYFPNEQGISETGNEHGWNIWIVGGRANVCSCSGCTQTPLASIVRTACENFRYISLHKVLYKGVYILCTPCLARAARQNFRYISLQIFDPPLHPPCRFSPSVTKICFVRNLYSARTR